MKAPKPAPPNERGTDACVRVWERQQEEDLKSHAQSAPQHVRDVEAVPAELRISAQMQQHADEQDGRNRGGEECVSECWVPSRRVSRRVQRTLPNVTGSQCVGSVFKHPRFCIRNVLSSIQVYWSRMYSLG